MDAMEALKTRRSVRRYKPDTVPREIIEDLIDTGRLAATALNIQPWEFIVIENTDMRRRIAEITDYGKFIAEAPALIVVASNDCKYYLEDCCAATQNILVAARAHGLGSCWVAGDKKSYLKKIADLLEMPETHRIVSFISVGYPQKEPSTPNKRSVEDVIHWERF